MFFFRSLCIITTSIVIARQSVQDLEEDPQLFETQESSATEEDTGTSESSEEDLPIIPKSSDDTHEKSSEEVLEELAQAYNIYKQYKEKTVNNLIDSQDHSINYLGHLEELKKEFADDPEVLEILEDEIADETLNMHTIGKIHDEHEKFDLDKSDEDPFAKGGYLDDQPMDDLGLKDIVGK